MELWLAVYLLEASRSWCLLEWKSLIKSIWCKDKTMSASHEEIKQAQAAMKISFGKAPLLGMSFCRGGCSGSSCRARVLFCPPQVRKQNSIIRISSISPIYLGTSVSLSLYSALGRSRTEDHLGMCKNFLVSFVTGTIKFFCVLRYDVALQVIT